MSPDGALVSTVSDVSAVFDLAGFRFQLSNGSTWQRLHVQGTFGNNDGETLSFERQQDGRVLVRGSDGRMAYAEWSNDHRLKIAEWGLELQVIGDRITDPKGLKEWSKRS